MIGRLKGILEVKKPPYLLVDVNGVGYEMQAPMSTIYQLPDVGQRVTLWVHLQVREDAQNLYGFYEETERTLFQSLIKISGVGPKMALTILSGIEVNRFVRCIEERDTGLLVRLPGVGKKTAERLILEMAGKLAAEFSENSSLSMQLLNSQRQTEIHAIAEPEAISALIALGYKPQEASRAIASVLYPNATSQDLIRRALQALSV